MKIAVFKETREGEKRVALTPQVVKQLVGKGYEIFIESGAGEQSAFQDSDYKNSGATIISSAEELCKVATVFLKINAFNDREISLLPENKLLYIITVINIKY